MEAPSQISSCFVHHARLRVTDSARMASHKPSFRGIVAASMQHLRNSLSLLMLNVLAAIARSLLSTIAVREKVRLHARFLAGLTTVTNHYSNIALAVNPWSYWI